MRVRVVAILATGPVGGGVGVDEVHAVRRLRVELVALVPPEPASLTNLTSPCCGRHAALGHPEGGTATAGGWAVSGIRVNSALPSSSALLSEGQLGAVVGSVRRRSAGRCSPTSA